MDVKGKDRSIMVVRKEVNGEVEWSDEDVSDGFEEKEVMNGYRDESDYKRKRVLNGGRKKAASSGGGLRCCQVEKCNADLSDSKAYHRRHKVCEFHANAQAVIGDGIMQRFCQQCSRFHELTEFDDTKKSCRKRLAGHNERRRKSAAESNTEGSGHKGMGANLNDMVDGQMDDKGRIKITIRDHTTYKHFQIR